MYCKGEEKGHDRLMAMTSSLSIYYSRREIRPLSHSFFCRQTCKHKNSLRTLSPAKDHHHAVMASKRRCGLASSRATYLWQTTASFDNGMKMVHRSSRRPERSAFNKSAATRKTIVLLLFYNKACFYKERERWRESRDCGELLLQATFL